MGRNYFLSDLENELTELRAAVAKHSNSVTKASETLASAQRLMDEGMQKMQVLETQIKTTKAFGAVGGHIDNSQEISVLVKLEDGQPVSYTPDGKAI